MNVVVIEEPGAIAETIDWWDLSYESPDEQLECPICRSHLVNPYSTDCGHTFCHQCLKESWKLITTSDFICPIDRRKLLSEPKPAPFVVKSMLDELEVSCPFSKRGCDYVGKRWSLESHVNTECEYVKVYCHKPCANSIEKRNFNPDGCLCELSGVEGSNTEEEINSDKNVDKNTNETSTDDKTDPIKCPGHVFGCTESRESVSDLDSHIDTCMHAKVFAAIESQSKKIVSLERENRSIKLQLDVFQRMMRKNTVELDSQILSEYERILRELREVGTTVREHQVTISNLVANKSRVNTDISYMQASMDNFRRQLMLVNQSQRQLSFYSTLREEMVPVGTLDESNEELNRKRSQQKL